MIKGKYVWALLYTFMLVSFSIYVLLDTFVITRVYSVVEVEQSDANKNVLQEDDNQIVDDRDDTETDTEGSSLTVTDSTYQDENISIALNEYRQNDTAIYIADVTVSSADYLKTAFAENTYGRNLTKKTSEIAENAGAILAINGDYYGARESGYVIRNGVLYRETVSAGTEDLVVYTDGSFEIINESDVSAEQLLENGAWNVLSFGPALIIDGEISVTTKDEVGKAKTDNPRTAIGIIDDLHYVLVVSDGRTEESEGLTLFELAEFMQELGVKTAYNLDGGGSSTMVFNGNVINNPTTSGKTIEERSVSDIVYIGY
ncbi:MAG: phosphodiester glycosidase family protein [Bacillus sp. (in: firmicutes)]